MRKYEIVEVSFDLSKGNKGTKERVVRTDLTRGKAQEEAFKLRHGKNNGNIARAYEVRPESKLGRRGREAGNLSPSCFTPSAFYQGQQ